MTKLQDLSKVQLVGLTKEEQDAIRKWIELRRQYDKIEEIVKTLAEKLQPIEKEVMDILYKKKDQMVIVDNYIVKWAGYEKKSTAYGKVFSEALKKICEQDQKILMELKDLFTTISRVDKATVAELVKEAPQQSGKVTESVKDKVIKFLQKVREKLSKILTLLLSQDTNINQFVNLVTQAEFAVIESVVEDLYEGKQKLQHGGFYALYL